MTVIQENQLLRCCSAPPACGFSKPYFSAQESLPSAFSNLKMPQRQPQASSSLSLKATSGKQSVPVFKVRKTGKKHQVFDLVVKIMLSGHVDKSWLSVSRRVLEPHSRFRSCGSDSLPSDQNSVGTNCVLVSI